VLTHDVSDGPAIGEPPGGEAALVVDAVPGVVALGDGQEQVIVVPHVRHRVAENVHHRGLVACRCCQRRRWRRSCCSAGGCRLREDGNGNNHDGESFHCCELHSVTSCRKVLVVLVDGDVLGCLIYLVLIQV
jgi:hypothetical protein